MEDQNEDYTLKPTCESNPLFYNIYYIACTKNIADIRRRIFKDCFTAFIFSNDISIHQYQNKIK